MWRSSKTYGLWIWGHKKSEDDRSRLERPRQLSLSNRDFVIKTETEPGCLASDLFFSLKSSHFYPPLTYSWAWSRRAAGEKNTHTHTTTDTVGNCSEANWKIDPVGQFLDENEMTSNLAGTSIVWSCISCFLLFNRLSKQWNQIKILWTNAAST